MNSTDSQGKLFVKNPKTNALLHLETAKSQKIINEDTFEQLKSQQERGVNKHETVVIPSQAMIHICTPSGEKLVSVSEALDKKIISEEQYDGIMKQIDAKKLGKQVQKVSLR